MSHKPHALFRLLDSIYGVPHLITEASLTNILNYLNLRSFDIDFSVEKKTKQDKAKLDKAVQLGSVGIINIHGSLTYKPVEALCGEAGTSYQGLIADMNDLIDQGAKTIIFDVASGGGEASHMFTTANEIRAIADEAGVKLISYVDELAASAAYGLACVADEVIIHPSARAGSIGAVIALMDKSKMMEDMGVKPIYITSTPGKVPFNADGSFSQDFLDKLKADVVKLGTQFADHVSKYTGVSAEEILALNAQVFDAETSLELGLVNKIMDHNQFAAYIAALV